VTAQRLDGTATAQKIREDVARGVLALRKEAGVTPGLTGSVSKTYDGATTATL
jgi:5,10-methylene-tetrahydrofolate dehydrogenase/methenyl tetrahydrofolate cyclohydrolase